MGSTAGNADRRFSYYDHPPIHGGHWKITLLAKIMLGSPPYTWGALTFPPAWRVPTKDHPHIHGEHTGASLLDVSCSGSPPYTWGAH